MKVTENMYEVITTFGDDGWTTNTALYSLTEALFLRDQLGREDHEVISFIGEILDWGVEPYQIPG